MQVKPQFFLTVILFLAAAGSPAFGDSGEALAGSHYVNMGSSFAAGSGIEPVKPGSIERCRQSAASYASLLADRLDLVLDDVSCGGAKSVHLLEPWNELPPQLEAVKSDTRLVTITVGGNDLNYVGNLFALSCAEDGTFTIEGRKIPCSKETPVDEDDYRQVKRNLIEIATQIRNRAPQATIIFVQYVTLVPHRLCGVTPLSAEEADRMHHIAQGLANVTTEAAKESGALLLETDELSADHTACDSDPWSIGAGTTPDNAEGMPWHPNALGHEAIANQLQQMLGKGR